MEATTNETTAPMRAIAEIQKEYTALLSKAGELEYQMKVLESNAMQIYERVALLSKEADAVKKQETTNVQTINQ